MKKTVENGNRFETDATRYADYLETAEGRLRTDLALANLCEFLPAQLAGTSLTALDVGCGTGAATVCLARRGLNVTALDSSPAMLELTKKTVAGAGVTEIVTTKYGDATELGDLLTQKHFDIIVCHNVLEYVASPRGVLHDTQRLMRDSSSIASVLVRSQAGEVLKAAIQTGDLESADHNLTAESATESLYQGSVRLFRAEELESMMAAASLRIIAKRGVRIVADYLPSKISRLAEYDRIFTLERKLGIRQEFLGIARYLQYLCSLSPSTTQQEASL